MQLNGRSAHKRTLGTQSRLQSVCLAPVPLCAHRKHPQAACPHHAPPVQRCKLLESMSHFACSGLHKAPPLCKQEQTASLTFMPSFLFSQLLCASHLLRGCTLDDHTAQVQVVCHHHAQNLLHHTGVQANLRVFRCVRACLDHNNIRPKTHRKQKAASSTRDKTHTPEHWSAATACGWPAPRAMDPCTSLTQGCQPDWTPSDEQHCACAPRQGPPQSPVFVNVCRCLYARMCIR